MEHIKPEVYEKINLKLVQLGVDFAENPRMDHVGHKIKAAIETKGITQCALAEAVGVSNNAVTKWIKTGKIAKKNIPKVAKELGLALSDFFDAQDDDLLHALYLLSDPKLKALMFASEKLPEYKKDILIQTSTALAEQQKPKQNGKQ